MPWCRLIEAKCYNFLLSKFWKNIFISSFSNCTILLCHWYNSNRFCGFIVPPASIFWCCVLLFYTSRNSSATIQNITTLNAMATGWAWGLRRTHGSGQAGETATWRQCGSLGCHWLSVWILLSPHKDPSSNGLLRSSYFSRFWMTEQSKVYGETCALTLGIKHLNNWRKSGCSMRNRWICEMRSLMK